MKQLLFLLSLMLSISLEGLAISKWDGSSWNTDWYTSSQGTVFHIRTASDLAGLSKNFQTVNPLLSDFSGCTIYLDNDIDLGNYSWTPIGGLENTQYQFSCFNGTFDGQNHTIKGLKINNNVSYFQRGVGLFGTANSNKTVIKNLNVEGSIEIKIYTNEPIQYTICHYGGIVGYMKTINGGNTTGLIKNCHSNVNIELNVIKSGNQRDCSLYVGGIVGTVENGTYIDHCSSEGGLSVLTEKGKIGGICGNFSVNNNKGAITKCVSTSTLYIIGANYMGGIAGYAQFNEISNCAFYGIINNGGFPNVKAYVGGIAAIAYNLSCCISAATIYYRSPDSYIAPIECLQHQGSSFKYCYYQEGMYNNKSQLIGESLTKTRLMDGVPIDGLDTNIWQFKRGEYPSIKDEVSTDINSPKVNSHGFLSINGKEIILSGYPAQSVLYVYEFNGTEIEKRIFDTNTLLYLESGIYIVKVDDKTYKVAIK